MKNKISLFSKYDSNVMQIAYDVLVFSIIVFGFLYFVSNSVPLFIGLEGVVKPFLNYSMVALPFLCIFDKLNNII